MTTAQLARRLGVSQPRIPVLEKAEVNKSITVESLERAATALDCELVYVFVPRTTFQDQVKRRAMGVAQGRLKSIQHTMALEDQSVSARENENQLARLARTLAEKSGSELWSEE
jgi:predicted DNA-binding mobile mystery protein A